MTIADLASAGAVWLLSSDPGEAVSSLRRLRDISGVSYLTVPGECAHALAPVVHELSGT